MLAWFIEWSKVVLYFGFYNYYVYLLPIKLFIFARDITSIKNVSNFININEYIIYFGVNIWTGQLYIFQISLAWLLENSCFQGALTTSRMLVVSNVLTMHVTCNQVSPRLPQVIRRKERYIEYILNSCRKHCISQKIDARIVFALLHIVAENCSHNISE